LVGPPKTFGRRHVDLVLQPRDVAHLVVGVGEVLEEIVALARGGQARQAPGLRVVGALHTVALLDGGALLELVRALGTRGAALAASRSYLLIRRFASAGRVLQATAVSRRALASGLVAA